MTSVPATAHKEEREENRRYCRLLDLELHKTYLPLVRKIAMKLVRRLPRQIMMDDMVSAGWVGMVEALRRRDALPTEGQFESYAAQRVRGAMLDYLRSLDPMTRKMRGASRQLTAAIRAFTARMGRSPAEEEIATELGLDLDDYRVLLHQVTQADPTRVELTDNSSPRTRSDAAPDIVAHRREVAERIAGAVQKIPERLQVLLSLYYQEECSFREVGEAIGVTEARICQLHAEAIHRIRAILEVGSEPPLPETGTKECPPNRHAEHEMDGHTDA
jgi:RNA polymerase sigma factor for flagellar operon FliA